MATVFSKTKPFAPICAYRPSLEREKEILFFARKWHLSLPRAIIIQRGKRRLKNSGKRERYLFFSKSCLCWRLWRKKNRIANKQTRKPGNKRNKIWKPHTTENGRHWLEFPAKFELRQSFPLTEKRRSLQSSMSNSPSSSCGTGTPSGAVTNSASPPIPPPPARTCLSLLLKSKLFLVKFLTTNNNNFVKTNLNLLDEVPRVPHPVVGLQTARGGGGVKGGDGEPNQEGLRRTFK